MEGPLLHPQHLWDSASSAWVSLPNLGTVQPRTQELPMTMDCSAGGRPPGGSRIKIVEATCTQGQARPPLCLEKKQHGGLVPPNKHLVTHEL